MTKSYFQEIFAYDAWANAQVLEMLRSLGTDHARGRGLLAHILAAQLVWMTRLREHDSSVIALFPDQTLDECEAWINHHRDAYAAYLDAIEDPALNMDIEYANMQGKRFSTPVRQILMQVANHGSYHRGQIALGVREMGQTPVNTDFITYTRL